MHNHHAIRRSLLIAATLACALLPVPAHADSSISFQHIPHANKKAAKEDFITRLDKGNVTAFIENVQRVVDGESGAMGAQDIADYFNNHIADDAQFESTMKYEMPGYPAQENAMNIGKTEYINGVLGGTGLMKRYEHNVQIKDIEINNGGRSAKVKMLILEKGEMPWPGEGSSDGKPAPMEPMPVAGKSECEQTIVISLNNFIQMKSAACYTALSFDPFQKSELGSDMFFGR